MLYYFFLLSFLVGAAKALSDIVQHSDVWLQSVLSDRFRITSFLGSADHTWKRKYKQSDSKIVAYLRKTVFVWTTDVWHASQTAGNVLTILAMYAAAASGLSLYLLLWFPLRAAGFTLLYSYILRR